MRETKHTCIVRIDGEPLLSRAQAYRQAVIAQERAWNEYRQSIGASGFPAGWPGSSPSFMFFVGSSPPEGWSKPDRKGVSRPKKGSEAAKAMAALPPRPSVRGVLSGIVNDLSYAGPGISGSGMIAFFDEGYSVGWVGGTFFARIPHAGRAAADHLARHPDHTVDEPAKSWRIPDGLTEISQAEFDLLCAQHRVELERRHAAKKEAA